VHSGPEGIDAGESSPVTVVLDSDTRDASHDPSGFPRHKGTYQTVGPANAKDGSVEPSGCEIEEIGLALRVVSVFIMLLL
jgi:hypothetical protein